jgi:hypothetical protein
LGYEGIGEDLRRFPISAGVADENVSHGTR